jgi:hypothetical protein
LIHFATAGADFVIAVKSAKLLVKISLSQKVDVRVSLNLGPDELFG